MILIRARDQRLVHTALQRYIIDDRAVDTHGARVLPSNGSICTSLAPVLGWHGRAGC